MVNYIRSEIYRNLRNKANYITLGGIMCFVVFLNVMLWGFAQNDINFPYATTKYSFSSLYCSLYIVLALCLGVVANTFTQEYKNQTLKNTIAFGISRSSIYFGKFVVSIINSIIMLISVLGVFIISAYILLENSGIEHLNTLLLSIFSAIPLFLSSLTIAHFCCFTLDSENKATFAWIGIAAAIPLLSEMLGRRIELFANITKYMPWSILREVRFNEVSQTLILGWTSQEGIIRSIIAGVLGIIIFYVAGLEIFKKKEVK